MTRIDFFKLNDMKRYVFYFLISITGFYSTAQIISTDTKIDSIMNARIQARLRSIGITRELPVDSSANDIVKWLLEFLGGFLSTLIMFFLHKWFPKTFPSAKLKYYKTDTGSSVRGPDITNNQNSQK